MVDANTAHSLHIELQPQKSKWPLLFKRKKQEPVPVPAPIKTEIVQLPRDVPPDEIIEEAIVLPSTDTIQTDDIELSPAPPPPTILITDLTVMPDRVVREGTLGIMANAHNRTPEELTDIVELNIDGKLEQAMTVTLQPGEVRDITFIITAREEGNHTVTLGSITGTFMVYPPG
jgi:hypothetical protein